MLYVDVTMNMHPFPHLWIIVDDQVIHLIHQFNRQYQDDLKLIDSTGWIPAEPVHPLRDGHKTVAEHLAEELKKVCAM